MSKNNFPTQEKINTMNINNNQMYSSNKLSVVPSSILSTNIIYTSYQDVDSQPSVIGQQGQTIQQNQIPTIQQYAPTTQNQYVSSFPSPMNINIKNENINNTQNQNQGILYSPVSTASSSSPTASNFFNVEPNNLNSGINGNPTTIQNEDNNNNNNNNDSNKSIQNERKISLSIVNENSENTNTIQYNSSNINMNLNGERDSNMNINNNTLSTSTAAASMNNGSYVMETQPQNTYSSNSYYLTNGSNNNQIPPPPQQQQQQQQQQVTPLSLSQQNISMINGNTLIQQSQQQQQQQQQSQLSSQNHQNNPFYIQQQNIPQQSIPQQNNQNIQSMQNMQNMQNMMVVNPNPQQMKLPQGQISILQNSTTYNQVYYSNGQPVPQPIPNPIQNQSVLINNINENIIREQQKISMELAIKRKKNTEAARRSRMRKMLRMENLEKYVKQLENENSTLNTRISILESDRPKWNEKENKLRDKIKELEKELTELKAKRKLEKNKYGQSILEKKLKRKEGKENNISNGKEE
ncbi:hypothetical protein BCR36DRAFT_350691 [Piromyces finnis]|uniref:BZIP domain-containing protein n=1 Tax=Piromyces finnis TaxID=1754191 RepID=A0A1Y1VC76_9FUNG|nr:hypothetical protein BCR36DRAFT_350691 [Piromyces finnis]|eukprot:ORX52270.1 hypothetical protein BCR36DRAFT_350691 [Piromyces finnis]